MYQKENTLKIGDYAETPRFLKVKIDKIYHTAEEARQNGYTKPTHYSGMDYRIFGKCLGGNQMSFAAVGQFFI